MKITSVQSFGEPTINDYYRHAEKEFNAELRDYEPSRLIGSKDDELIEYFFQKYALFPIEIDESRQTEVEKLIKKEDVTTPFGDEITKDVTYARITFPLKPKQGLSESFKYHTQTHTLKVYEFDFNEAQLTVSIETPPQSIQAAIDEHLNIFSQRSAEINQNNIVLKEKIKTAIEERKKSINKDDELFDSMLQKVTIPLKRKTKEDVYIPLPVKEELKSISKPSSTPPRELVLTDEQVQSIIEVVDSDGRNFENTPTTYSKLSEPDLRNIMLTHLNFYFPDDATGETFIKLGKSDIRLKVFEGQILVAECKYWYGEKEFVEAIDQLFGYLTWRHNYGIVIVFSKAQDFSGVLDKIKQSLQHHKSYKSGFKEISPTHFLTLHSYQEDSKKQVLVHTLVYNLYSKEE